MDLLLKDKVFIVSGGSKGIGEAITRAILAEEGRVMIATRSVDSTNQLLKDYNTASGRVASCLGELDSSQCKKVVEETIKTFGRIDGIVNNAGFNDGAGLRSGPEAFRRSVGTNLFHYFDLVHYALDELKKHSGAVVNISSKVAMTGQGNTSGYAAAKGAQLALTREWAAELKDFNIRVNAVLPAEVMTPLYRKWLDNSFDDPAKKEEEICARIPLGKRMTTSAEIANTVVFLLSERSGHTTGQLLIVDGGYTHLDRALT
jgi:L-fucose dehydrogenase